MAFKPGRITLNEPNDWDQMGESVTVRGSYIATSLADGLQKREQILAYSNNVDEPTIPVVIDGMPNESGYYRATGAHILTDEFVRKKGNLSYELQLERMPGYASPLLESTLIGDLVPNAASILKATSQPWHAVPGAATAYAIVGGISYSFGLQGGAAAIRTAADGAMGFTGLTTANYANKASFQLPAASFYTSAAQLQGGVVLSSLYTLVGRQSVPVKGDWQMTNGLMQVQDRGAGDGIRVKWYNGSSWGAFHDFQFGLTGWTSVEGPLVTILRNAPEQVVIRLNYGTTGGGVVGGPFTVDLWLRRGARVLRCFLAYGPLLSSPSSVFVKHVGALACTAITGGIRATANDADGNRPVMASAMTVTNDLVNGSLTKTTTALSDTFDFGIGNEIPGATGQTGNQAQDLVYQYVAGQAESQRVVVR